MRCYFCNVAATLQNGFVQRRDVNATQMQRCCNIVCLLGSAIPVVTINTPYTVCVKMETNLRKDPLLAYRLKQLTNERNKL